MTTKARFNVGQIVINKQHHYRGVIVDIDPVFQPSGKWLPMLAQRDATMMTQAWYRVLVDESAHITYVAEQHLELAVNLEPIDNPNLEYFLGTKTDGSYISKRSVN